MPASNPTRNMTWDLEDTVRHRTGASNAILNHTRKTWTLVYREGAVNTSQDYPFEIDGYPVVIHHSVPPELSGGYAEKPPYHTNINPRQPVPDTFQLLVRATFPSAIGFAVMIDGYLRVYYETAEEATKINTEMEFDRIFGGLLVLPCVWHIRGLVGRSANDTTGGMFIKNSNNQVSSAGVMMMRNGEKLLTVTTHPFTRVTPTITRRRIQILMICILSLLASCAAIVIPTEPNLSVVIVVTIISVLIGENFDWICEIVEGKARAFATVLIGEPVYNIEMEQVSGT